MQESFRSFYKRINAGLPLISDEEKEFESEEKEIQAVLDRRRERREKLLWKSIPLLARNWKLFCKYPKLYNIPSHSSHSGAMIPLPIIYTAKNAARLSIGTISIPR